MKKILHFFGRLFYWLWKLLTTGCLVVTNLIVFASILFLLAVFFQPEVSVPRGSALILDPTGDIVEQPTAVSPISRLVNGFAGIPLPRETLLQDILDAITTAAGDDRIKIIVLSLAGMESSSLNQLDAIGQAIAAFRRTGKKVIAVDDQYSQGNYYLASYADEIYLNPMGSIGLRGFAVFRLYLKDMIDKLAINFHIFKVGSYKSATEPFVRNDMSEEDKMANRLWVNNLWDYYCREVARNRSLQTQFINTFINGMPRFLRSAEGSMSRMALEADFVDGIKTRNEIDRYLTGIVGRSADGETYKHIRFSDYLRKITPSYTEKIPGRDRIGLIVAQGNILYGQKVPGQISSENLCSLIREARNDEAIKAVVLRIDSGGGSAIASEMIRQELLLLQEAGKTLVVSMGSMAASGAYWISASADRIIASPATLTGSIGIFGIIPTFEQSIAKIGMHSDGIATTKIAGAENPTTAFAPELGEIMQLSIEEGYDRFLRVVSEGRDLPRERIEKIAQGRVWDGATARELGLVDQLGNLDEAITAAAELAGLSDYSTLYVREKESAGNELLRQFGVGTLAVLERYNPARLPFAPLLASMSRHLDFSMFENDPTGLYMHCLLPRTVAAF